MAKSKKKIAAQIKIQIPGGQATPALRWDLRSACIR